jgi:CxxC-x17-CxxC domain-containing protein
MPDSDIEEIWAASTKHTDIVDEFEDKSILCIDCDYAFIWTAGEQVFYRDKDLLNPPKRCKLCKKAKNFRLNACQKARSAGKKHHYEIKAQCAKCQLVTTVPFYPSQGRPVYCRTCFTEIKIRTANGSDG